MEPDWSVAHLHLQSILCIRILHEPPHGRRLWIRMLPQLAGDRRGSGVVQIVDILTSSVKLPHGAFFLGSEVASLATPQSKAKISRNKILPTLMLYNEYHQAKPRG